MSDLAASREGDGDGAGRDLLGEFGDGEDIVGVHNKEGGMDFSAERLNGRADGLETILGILEDAGPSGTGIADLVTEMGHDLALSGRRFERKGCVSMHIEWGSVK